MRKITFNIILLCTCAFLLLLCGCGSTAETPATEPSAVATPTTMPTPTAEPSRVIISELMTKNRATLMDGNGDFSDWLELENLEGEAVTLTGWRLSDGAGKDGWTLPAVTLGAGERLLVFASGSDIAAAELHTNFSLSKGETVYLYDAAGTLADSAECTCDDTDVSLARDADGEWHECLYPTPGLENTRDAYCRLQEGSVTAGPLVIYEAQTANIEQFRMTDLGYCDWVEIKNISASPVLLSDYYLSDDADDYRLWRFPSVTLEPEMTLLVYCDDASTAASDKLCTGFALNSTHEQLFLTNEAGEMIDHAALRDIPYSASFGRIDGQNGWFYFSRPTPNGSNASGMRTVSETPHADEPDGVFNGVDGVTVSLGGEGEIRYTTNGSLPTEKSTLYTGPFTLRETTVVRAVCIEKDALASRALSLSYIINENHTLPVLSLVSDDVSSFTGMYYEGIKDLEQPGSLSMYEPDGSSFTIGCGIKMNGETSLTLPRKNMSVRFRGAYGDETLCYDIFGGGVTEFTNLVIRAGQCQHQSIIKNEVCQNLCLGFSDNVITQRSRFSVLYVNGQYFGLYALKEKTNEQFYASIAGVSRDSVEMWEAPFQPGESFYDEVIAYTLDNDLSVEENYRYICRILDVDGLIDWTLFEGYLANTDILGGNLRFCRSAENGGQWKVVFFDLDSTLQNYSDCFGNLLSDYAQQSQIGRLLRSLLANAEFRSKLMSRGAEVFKTALSNESVLAEFDALATVVEPEVERHMELYDEDMDAWKWNIEYFDTLLNRNGWQGLAIENFCSYLNMTQAERAEYFG